MIQFSYYEKILIEEVLPRIWVGSMSVEESVDSRKNLKIFEIFLLILIIVTFTPWHLITMTLFPQLDPTYEPEYEVTVWVEPQETEFFLHLDFYLAQDDVGTIELRKQGNTIRVESGNEVEYDLLLYTIPLGITTLWVESYVNEDGVRVTYRLDIGTKTTVSLVECSYEVLVEPLEST